MNQSTKDEIKGTLHGAKGSVKEKAGQVINNLIGVLIAWGLAIGGTWIILKVCDAVTGVRAGEQAEIEGLDLSMHGEEGYNFEA